MRKRHAYAAIAALAALQATAAQADAAWPKAHPITMVLPAGAGGSSDPLTRYVSEEIGKRIGQSFIVQNKPGAGGNVGMVYGAKARPDGYTLTISWTGPMATNLALYKEVGFSPQKDFAPVGMIGCTPNVLAVDKSSPASSLQEFNRLAKEKPEKFSYGTTGVGSSWHIAAEMLNRDLGDRLVHVPYQSPGAALTDMKGRRLDAIFPVIPMTVPHARAGEMKVLAVFSKERSSVLPEVPTTVEQGFPDLLSDTCFALLAPAGTPAPIVDQLNKALNQVLSDQASRTRIEDMGIQIRSGPPSQLQAYLDTEIPRQARLVRAMGVSPE